MNFALSLLLLAVLAALQNMAFTWSSRTRNQSDHRAHRVAAIFSNGIWFAVSVLIWSKLWSALTTGEWWKVIVVGVVYVVATTEGSVWMMRHLVSRGR